MLCVLAAALIAQAPVHEDLVPSRDATEEAIPVPPQVEPSKVHTITRHTQVDKPIGFQNVSFGAPPERVIKQLGKYHLVRDPKAPSYPTYVGSGEVLGVKAHIYASFSPKSRKLFTIGVVSHLVPGEPRSALTAMFETRRRILTEKYGLPTQETHGPEGSELIWIFRDGQLQCQLGRGSVGILYFHDKTVALTLEEEEELEAARKKRFKDQL